ncbi:MAG: site-specific DNA-methyltransferase [Methylococcales bacterium]|nr:site-specific DNA-methyltransferase [Methylococcales bacterium]
MPKIKLTPEDKAKLIEAINNETEPTPDLLPKLFPGTAEKFEKFDVQALDRAKIPTLEYAGKRSKVAILTEAGAGIGAAPLQTVRCFGEAKGDEWKNMIVQGDNLQFLKTCYNNTDPLIKDKVKEQVKLIYIDPPFATKSDFKGKEGEKSYSDKVAAAEFIEILRERLIYMRELLADDGSIYLHLDQKMSHYLKIVMDEVFGRNNFRNCLMWQKIRTTKAQSSGFGNVQDNLFLYMKSDDAIFHNQYIAFNPSYIDSHYKEEKETGRLYRTVSMLQKGSGPARNFGEKILEPPTGRHWIWSQERIDEAMASGRITFTSNGRPEKIQYLDEMEGDVVADIWTDIFPINSQAIEYIGYPTQKPEALLERIIKASSNEGDLVVDFFCGSGTTAAVAEKLGRRWIACDFGKHAIYTMQKRILNISESRKLKGNKLKDNDVKRCETCSSVIEENEEYKKCKKCGSIYQKEVKEKSVKYGQSPKPFSVLSSGAYDFSHIMELRKHKETYIDFVLGLFQLSRDEEKTGKFKLANIYAIKDGDPVEVYPVWDDQFLKEVKIDEEYLQGIITQSGGKLKGDYYIITPESCANIGDTTLKNQDRQDINFHIQTFPYKVLEEVSRKLELQEQPSSQADVNNLITSTAFYFNEEVHLEAERTNHGLKITRFETKILNKEGNRFAGFSGLAMLLVDLDYEAGKPFDMDSTVFAKDIGEDGSVKMAGMAQRVGLIAIDKHGNESKPFNLK